MIELKEIDLKYKKLKSKDEFIALNNVSLKINDGEKVGIIGFSGAGKSSLLRIINGLIKPSNGEVYIDDTDLCTLNKKQLNNVRQSIGMVFQDFNLLNGLTIFENVALPLRISKKITIKNEIKTKVEALLELVGLKEKKNAYPNQLSGGQKQRVAIARALINNPKYLLCDEITSALDLDTAIAITKLLNDIHQKLNITIIFVTHQIEIIKNVCEKIIVMQDGEVLENKTILDFFKNPESSTGIRLCSSLIEDGYIPTSTTYKLVYKKSEINQNILSSVCFDHNVLFSIIYAKTIEFQNDLLGFLYIDFDGVEKNIAEVIKKLYANNVEVYKNDQRISI